MPEEIINKVSQSELLTLDLEQFYPEEKIRIFDLKPFLFMELILKEKDFRAALLATDWSTYKDEIVGVLLFCRCGNSGLGLYACHQLSSALC